MSEVIKELPGYDVVTGANANETARLSVEKNRTNYERAKKYAPMLEEQLLIPYKAMVGNSTGITAEFMITNTEPAVVRSGDVAMPVQGERRYSKPSYKQIVESWESYLTGINRIARRMTIAGVRKEDNKNYIQVRKLTRELRFLAEGSLEEMVEFNIDLEHSTGLWEATEFELPEKVKLNTECAIAYVNGLRIQEGMEHLVKAYEKDLAKVSRTEDVKEVPVTQKIAYEVKTEKRVGDNFPYVVKSMITMPTERDRDIKNVKELEELSNHWLSVAERVEKYKDKYDLYTPNGTVIYVSVNSVLARMNQLKGEEPVKAKALKVKHKERIK